MNAHELANKMEQLAGHFHNEAINMLRQQADRIAKLSKNVDELEEELLKTPQIKELSDEEIELYKHLKWTIEAYRDCAGFENKQLAFHHVCEALDDIDQYQKGKENE